MSGARTGQPLVGLTNSAVAVTSAQDDGVVGRTRPRMAPTASWGTTLVSHPAVEPPAAPGIDPAWITPQGALRLRTQLGHGQHIASGVRRPGEAEVMDVDQGGGIVPKRQRPGGCL